VAALVCLGREVTGSEIGSTHVIGELCRVVPMIVRVDSGGSANQRSQHHKPSHGGLTLRISASWNLFVKQVQNFCVCVCGLIQASLGLVERGDCCARHC
jgi:hypothetical protein